jgi:hypothetical protein
VFVAGYTYGSLGGQNVGSDDAFLARYDASGKQTWIKQFGTSAADSATALAPDGVGGVFVTGTTAGSLGDSNLGSDDVFLARYDGNGNQAWIRQFGTTASDVGNVLTSDGDGGAFLAGTTAGNLGGPNAGSLDAFVARYNAAGFSAWIRQFGTSAEDYPNGLAQDGAGGFYVEGYTLGDLGGPNAGNLDVFLARCGGDGKQAWITQFGTSDYDRGNAIALDQDGGVFIVGYTQGSLGGANAGSDDIFLTRYDSGGGQTWIEQFGTTESDFTTALTPDGTGGVFIGGGTWGNLGGEYGGGVDNLAARYDAAGNRVWITQFGTGANEFATAVAQDAEGGVFVAGYTYGSLGGPNAGQFDAFLARFGSDTQDDLIWSRVYVAGPSARLTAGMAYDAARQETVLFGGWSEAILRLGDQWTWNGIDWQEVKADPMPEKRSHPGLTYDSGRQRIVLFAGVDNSQLDDTWEWDGSAWTQAHPAHVPPARREHSIAYDAERGVTVIYGGIGDNFPIKDDTWSWDGSDWTFRAEGSPSVRVSAAACYDSNRNVVVLFGGQIDANGTPNRETWEWNGSDWTLRATNGPSARWGAAMVYDEARHLSILFGGNNGGSSLDDTWTWDGSTWKQITNDGPPARYKHAMVYDSARDAVVLFGGFNGDYLCDTWELSPAPRPCAADLNGDGTLDLFDFLTFVNLFNANDPRADCVGNCKFDLFDFLCFVNAFNAGC